MRLVQESKILGNVEVLVAPDGLRVTNSKLGTVLVSSPPTWMIIMYCDKTKRYFVAKTVADYRNSLALSSGMVTGLALAAVPFKKTGTSIVAGLPTAHYESTEQFVHTQERGYQERTELGGSPKYVHFDTFDSLKVPDIIGTILEKMYAAPAKLGVPAHLSYDAIDQSKHVYMSTLNAKLVDYKKSDFDYPKNYRQVESDAQVTGVNGDDVKDLFRL
jgi:hypothetical protein